MQSGGAEEDSVLRARNQTGAIALYEAVGTAMRMS
jgi:hypothetical protein